MGTALDAPGSPFGDLENATRDSELSGKMARELPPLPGPAVTLFHSTHLSSLEGFAAQDGRSVGLGSSDSDKLIILRWRAARLFVTVSCPAHLSQAKESCLRRWLDFILHFSGVIQLECEPYSYTCQVVACGSSLVGGSNVREVFFRIDEPKVGASRVCAKECTTGVSRGNLGILSFCLFAG